jgi:hypothetical protein
MSKLLGCSCTKLGVKTIQDGNLEPLYDCLFLPLPLTFKISVFGKTVNYVRGNKGKITACPKIIFVRRKLDSKNHFPHKLLSALRKL